jgi:hypothetical protein
MTAARVLPDDVAAAARRHLAAVDDAAPEFVRALYITGSVALGDYRPGRSDIDFMAFTSRSPAPADVAALRDFHDGVRGPLCYDGAYVSWDTLPRVPDDSPAVPHVMDGVFSDSRCGELTPSTWTEFSRYAIAVRGPEAVTLGVSVPPDRLSQWNLGNLNSYWLNLANRTASVLAERDPAGTADAEAVAWCALGAARLHYTLATGDITSKSGAGRYALEHFGAYADVITAALAWRATGDGEFTNAAALRGADLIRAVVANANHRWS